MPLSAQANIAVRMALVFCLAILAACERRADGPSITGTLSYVTPIELPRGAQLEVLLTDVTGDDGQAVPIASVVTDIDELPHAYVLPYAADKIKPAHRYMVDARVRVDGALRYTTDTPQPVLTEGHGTQRDVSLALAGDNRSMSAMASSMRPTKEFHGEWRAGSEVSIYAAGFVDGALQWLKEDRGGGAGVVQARYEFNGGYLRNYSDSTPMTIHFDEHGKPLQVISKQKEVSLSKAAEQINAVRNRAALLRSAALAASETKQHRDETEGLVPTH